MWANYVSSSSSNDLKKINLSQDLFNRMAVSSCFNQCARTDIDTVFLNEMECTYKCLITYKQAFSIVKELDANM
jgi:hypothetical protein